MRRPQLGRQQARCILKTVSALYHTQGKDCYRSAGRISTTRRRLTEFNESVWARHAVHLSPVQAAELGGQLLQVLERQLLHAGAELV